MRVSTHQLVSVAAALLFTASCAGTTRVNVVSSDSNSTPSAAAQTSSTTTSTTSTTVFDPGTPADTRTLTKVETITEGELSPKSVISTPSGYMFAQNMIYKHNVGVYDREMKLVKTIPDEIDLADWGLSETSQVLQGGPVEAAATADGKHVYLSNYEMSGPGYTNPGADSCSPGGWDNSFLYRIDTETLELDMVVEVGPVPKYVAVTPDAKTVLVTNWCGYDMSVVDVATKSETRRVDIGRYPRGIAVSPDGTVAYVTVMGGTDIAVVDLSTFDIRWIRDVGAGPRHVVLSPDGSLLYATLNKSGEVIKIDPTSGEVLGRVSSPIAPRSMDISSDGTALYVVNYESDEISKIRTSDMTEIQRLPAGHHPIGIAYDKATQDVWVANYSGSLMVYSDEE